MAGIMHRRQYLHGSVRVQKNRLHEFLLSHIAFFNSLLKEKLAGLQQEELQTPASQEILIALYKNELRTLFLDLIKELKRIEPLFLSSTMHWRVGASNELLRTLDALDQMCKDEKLLKINSNIGFSYSFFGFKKAGTEAFNVSLNLNIQMNTFWYGFDLVNSNDRKPFLKKLYHQPFTEQDKETVINRVIDHLIKEEIESRVDRINL